MTEEEIQKNSEHWYEKYKKQKEINKELVDELENVKKCEEYQAQLNIQRYFYIRKIEQQNKDLKDQNRNLQVMLQAEREVRCNADYLKHVTELEHENEYARSLIRSLLDNSDEYARQRAEDFMKEEA